MIIAAYAGTGKSTFAAHFLRAEREFDYVLIPTDMEVVCRLREEYGRKVVLCYPADELREEYRERFFLAGLSHRAYGDLFEPPKDDLDYDILTAASAVRQGRCTLDWFTHSLDQYRKQLGEKK